MLKKRHYHSQINAVPKSKALVLLPGNMLQTLRNTRRQGNRPDRRTKVRRGAVDAVSKNAFAQPFFTAVRNSFTYPILILCQMIYLHFCGAWVYRQSEPVTQSVTGIVFGYGISLQAQGRMFRATEVPTCSVRP